MDLPFVLVGAVLIGAGAGYLLDRKTHTAPALMLVFGGFGFLAGIFEVLRRLKQKNNGN